MNPYGEKSKFRTDRNAFYEALRADLRDCGYDPLRPIFLKRDMRYRLLVVAVNHLAHVLKRDPHRVYQALLCRAEKVAHGEHYCAYKQARPPKGSNFGGVLSVICPFCGKDLISAGKVTQFEITAEAECRKSHHKSEK